MQHTFQESVALLRLRYVSAFDRSAAHLRRSGYASGARDVHRLNSQDLVYFHDRHEVFHHDPSTNKVSASGSSRNTAAQLRYHSERERRDWADYRRGAAGDGGALHRLQLRRELDMVEDAYQRYNKDLKSSMNRSTLDMPMLMRLVQRWREPTTAAVSALQDAVLFRGSDLAALSAAGTAPWLPPHSVMASFQQLLNVAPPAGPAAEPGPILRSWAPLLLLLPANEAAIISESHTLHMCLKSGLSDHWSSGGRQQSSRWIAELRALGDAVVTQANMHAAAQRITVTNRSVATHNALVQARQRHEQDPVTGLPDQLAHKLGTYAAPVPQERNVWAEFKDRSERANELKLLRLLGPHRGAVAPREAAALGAVLLNVAVSQAQLHGRAAFAHPVPWLVKLYDGSDDPTMRDFGLEVLPQLRDQLTSYAAVAPRLTPIYTPSVVPSLPWSGLDTGGYLRSGEAVRVDLVRTKCRRQLAALRARHQEGVDHVHRQWQRPFQHSESAEAVGGKGAVEEPSPEERKAARAGPEGQWPLYERPVGLSRVYEVLNILGQQSWRVNRRVLEVVEAAWAAGEAIGDIPPRTAVAVPPAPGAFFHARAVPIAAPNRRGGFAQEQRTGQLLVGVQPVARGVLRATLRQQQRANKINRELLSLQSNFLLQLKVAQSVSGYDKIYFPHNVDFRGRAYPMPPHFNHMSNDLCRGLLLFGERRPLGASGFRWLLIHLANLCGVVDKLSFDARAAWSLRHVPDIADSAARPLSGRRWWLRAENPWEALAACFEIDAALRSGDVATYECALPVHQDGSCNGLQHYVALGRDVDGARAVNLLDSDRPQDVYSRVAAKLKERIDADAAAGVAPAQQLLGAVNRKLVKQTVMTTVYGVTFIGARDQIHNRLLERGWEDGVDSAVASSYAAKQTLQAVKGVFNNASLTMDWLKGAAHTVAAHGGKHCSGDIISWTTPLNLPVTQPYRSSRGKVTRTVSQDLVETEEQEDMPVDKRKQRSAFPPNFIHSLDATHMMLTAAACHGRGLSFAGVHDSYWTHAGSIDDCRDVLRQQFVQLYSKPVLQDLRTELLREHAGVRLQKLPATGDLDLEDVKHSTYFFN